METPLRLPAEAVARLRCPVCGSALRREPSAFACTGPSCNAEHPIVDGIPILLDESASVFRVEDFTGQRRTTYALSEARWKTVLKRRLPRIGRNLAAEANLQRLVELCLAQSPRPLILVVGGRTVGEGMQAVVSDPRLSLVESDVAFGPRTSIVSDAHSIPFEDRTFDAVIAQAVLEHVVDPWRCVSEIHRVLKPAGLVYAETPFMQQVHGGRFDFTRFTLLGHRRLFRQFEELRSGVSGGPGMALAWAYQFFLLSFAGGRWLRWGLLGLARLTAFPLKTFDRYLQDKPGAADAASGVFFLGRRSETMLSDRELIQGYRGAAYL